MFFCFLNTLYPPESSVYELFFLHIVLLLRNYKLTKKKQAVPSVFLIKSSISLAPSSMMGMRHLLNLRLLLVHKHDCEHCWLFLKNATKTEHLSALRDDIRLLMLLRLQSSKLKWKVVFIYFLIFFLYLLSLLLRSLKESCDFTTMMIATENNFPSLQRSLLIGGYFSSGFPHHIALFILRFFWVTNDVLCGKTISQVRWGKCFLSL